jgi:hypothetical protein
VGDWTAPLQPCSWNSGWPMDLKRNQSRRRLKIVAKRMLMQDPGLQSIQSHEFKRTCIQR